MPRASRSRRSRRPVPPVLQPTNYKLLLAGVLAIVLGFTLMYAESALEGVLSLYVGPLLLMGGYVGIIYALLWRPDQPEAASDSEA
ncbi:MAG: DUF3098 domain-containing protein [Longimonas sp.]|uniref:DUF3098 domain-containing protein n=1 Tax=Longimonas sp. TaxID=2039626 RepID=UPI00397724C3